VVLPISKLVDEKIEALLRRNKPRDFFDLYFLLRSRRGIERIIPIKNKLLKAVLKLDSNAVKRELKVLLPVSHLRLLKSFPRLLASELKQL
jgi:predicted nucleotidyltransferase component of viral defense system